MPEETEKINEVRITINKGERDIIWGYRIECEEFLDKYISGERVSSGEMIEFFYPEEESSFNRKLLHDYGELLFYVSGRVDLSIDSRKGELSPETLEGLAQMTKINNNLFGDIKGLRKELQNFYSREKYNRNTLRIKPNKIFQ